jgi:hypothetical protein
LRGPGGFADDAGDHAGVAGDAVLQVDDVLPRREGADEGAMLRRGATRAAPRHAHGAEEIVVGEDDERARAHPLGESPVILAVIVAIGLFCGGGGTAVAEPAVRQIAGGEGEGRKRGPSGATAPCRP